MSNIFSRIFALGAALCAVMLQSCSSDVVYDEFVTLPEDAWNQDSLAVFRADISDTTSLHDVWIQVRNDNNYSYANLWLFIDLFAPDGSSRRDTFECMLARPDGSWLGSGWGSLYSQKCLFMRGVRFNHAGPYTFRFTQGMRAENIDGIHNIGLLIEPHKTQQ